MLASRQLSRHDKNVNRIQIIIIVSCFTLFIGRSAFADEETQTSDDAVVNSIESELETQIPETGWRPKRPPIPEKPPQKVDYSAVKNSAPLSDVVIVQKNYLPKTERFQFFEAISLVTNDVFHRTWGGTLRASYHFNETWGAELSGFLLNSDATSDIEDLKSQQIAVSNLVSAQNYLGFNIYFNSIYGKAAINDQIIPFEIYQTLGFGKTQTSSGPADTISVGIGQIFAKTRSSTYRIDLNVLSFSATNTAGDKQLTNLILLSLGWGQLYPGVGRR